MDYSPWIFQLSRTQHRRIATGRTLEIALPHPTHTPRDYLAWAFSALPDVAPIIVQSRREIITTRITHRGNRSLSRLLGEIYQGPATDSELMHQVVVILASVTLDEEKEGVIGPQWPQAAFSRVNPNRQYGGTGGTSHL